MSGAAAREDTAHGQGAGDKNGSGACGNLDSLGEYEKEKNHYAQYFGGDSGQSGHEEELRTTPLFSLMVKCSANQTLATSEEGSSSKGSKAMNLCGSGTIGSKSSSESSAAEGASDSDAPADSERESLFPQYGLLGHRIDNVADQNDPEPIFLNTNPPVSSFICGSQGSGKSYTLSCMLENCLLQTTCP